MKEIKYLNIDKYYVAGVIALFIWTFVPGIKRLLCESLSMYITGAISSIAGGIILIFFRLKNGGFKSPFKVNKKYWVLCAIPYLIYMLCGVCSSGLASSRQGSMIVNLFTALWPLSGMVCSVFIMKKKTTRLFPLSCLISAFGVGFASLTGYDGGFTKLIESDGVAILFAICEAVSWGVYSGFYSRFVKNIRDDYQPIIQLVYGLIMMAVVIIKDEKIVLFDRSILFAILFQIIFVTVLGNYLWNYSMTGKNSFNIILLSNLSPVFSSIFSSLLLGIGISWQLMIGAVIVVMSTILAKKCIV